MVSSCWVCSSQVILTEGMLWAELLIMHSVTIDTYTLKWIVLKYKRGKKATPAAALITLSCIHPTHLMTLTIDTKLGPGNVKRQQKEYQISKWL